MLIIGSDRRSEGNQGKIVRFRSWVRHSFGFPFKQNRCCVASTCSSLRGRVDKALSYNLRISLWWWVRIPMWSHFWRAIFSFKFLLFSITNSNSFQFFYGKPPNSSHTLLQRLSALPMSMLWHMSLVGRLGLDTRSWVLIGLGDIMEIWYCGYYY